MSDRRAALAEKLKRIADAKHMMQTDLWDAAWTDFEQELLERLLKCGPDEDWARYRLQTAIEVSRHVKHTIESAASGESGILKELDILEGRKIAPIA